MRQTADVSTRNLYWLVAIVVVGVVLWVVGGWLWGLIGAVATLIVSEGVERADAAPRGGSGQLRGAIASKRGSSK